MTNSLDALWYARCPVPTALGLASQMGWLQKTFGEVGVTVHSVQDSPDPNVRASHFDHRLKHSVRQGGSIPAIWARARGAETRVLGLTWTEETQTILALPGAGIQNVSDLAGKRLAIPKHVGQVVEITGTGALRGILSALATQGLSERDVRLVDVVVAKDVWDVPGSGAGGPRPRRNEFWPDVYALIRGDVDAIFVKGARGKEVESFLGATVVYDLSKHPDWRVRINNGVPRPLTVDAKLLDDHPDLIERLLKLVTATSRWAKEHRAQVRSHISREVFSIEPWIDAAYPSVNEHLDTVLDDWLVEGLQDYTTFLVRHGVIPREFDVRSWIVPEPIGRVECAGSSLRPVSREHEHAGAVLAPGE
jgi:ABC-type nitrate/sulfonate/bicarbonate transport system substrate-binding protein